MPSTNALRRRLRVNQLLIGAMVIGCASEDDSSLPHPVGETQQGLAAPDAPQPDGLVFVSKDGEIVRTVSVPESDRAYSVRMSPEEISNALASGDSPNATTPGVSDKPDSTQIALDYAASRPPKDLVPVTILLEDANFDFRSLAAFKGLEEREADARRGDLIAARKRQLEALNQTTVLERLRAMGASIGSVRWLTNSIVANVPAGQLRTISNWPEARGLYYHDPNHKIASENNGAHIRDTDTGTLTGNFVINGFLGGSGGSGGNGRVKLAILEDGDDGDFLTSGAEGFRNIPNGSNRVNIVNVCNPTCAATAAQSTASSHATRVTWAAAGSIEQGQDTTSPTFPNQGTPDQIARSGVTSETFVQFYFLQDTDATPGNAWASTHEAIEAAVANGADIINMSFGAAGEAGECDNSSIDTRNFDLDFVNYALKVAFGAGVLLVTSAGNGHSIGETCSVTYPHWRPEILSVGAADTPLDHTLEWAVLRPESSRGAVRVGNVSNAHPAVQLVAPGCIEMYFIGNSGYGLFQNGGSNGTRCGTSYASPIVAGSAALLKNALHVFGLPDRAYGGYLYTSMLLMGDLWAAPAIDDDWGLEQQGPQFTVSKGSGVGKLKMHFPGDATMGSTSKMAFPPVEIVTSGNRLFWAANPGGSANVNLPMPSSATQLKWAIGWFHPNQLERPGLMVPRIVESPCGTLGVDADPSSGTVRASGTALDRQLLQMKGSAVAGKCLWLELVATDTPGGKPVAVYTAQYWHSGDPAIRH